MNDWSPRISEAELDHCVRVALDDWPALEQAEAWQKLATEIRLLAKEVSRRFPERVGRELEDLAVDKIYCALRGGLYDSRRGKFRAWAARVLRNLAISVMRTYGSAAERTGHLSQSGDWGQQCEPADSTELDSRPTLQDRSNAMDQALELVREGQHFTSGTDYVAVFLLYLRLAAAARLAASCPGDEQMERLLPELSLYVELIVPWRNDDQQRRCRPSWPSLAGLWTTIARHLNCPPHACGAELLCDIVSGEIDQGPPLRLPNWYQLCKRAKLRAQEQLSGPLWEELFAPLLPARTSPSNVQGGGHGH